MIKIFRHIRQTLIMENSKSARYFKYAIGEIILVVIGILIALQINNWNEQRKERQQEKELLSQLKSEFLSNLEQLDEKIAIRERMIQSSIKLLYYIDHPAERNNDSILKHAGQIILAPTFDPIVNDIISSGRIQLLQNNILKEKLSRWTSELIQVTEEEQAWLNFRTNYYGAALLKYYSYRNIIDGYWKNNMPSQFELDEDNDNLSLGKSITVVNITALLESTEFESIASNCASLSKITNNQSYSLRNRIVELLDLIENDLKVLND